jgi:hypothetical protein
MKPVFTVIGTVAVCALVVGCSSSKPTSNQPAVSTSSSTSVPPSTSTTAVAATSPTTVSTAQFGRKYLAIINPLNADIAALKNDSSPTQGQLDSLAQQLDHAEGQMLGVQWPGRAETDVRALASDMGQMAAALENGDASSITTTSQSVASASAIVRSDLGLPVSNLNS